MLVFSIEIRQTVNFIVLVVCQCKSKWKKVMLVELSLLTLCSEKVRTQNVASSMVSSRVTWIIPYVSVPRFGQY